MPDAFAMRFQLQRVVIYRELCRGVQRSGRENVFFALVMLGYGYFQHRLNVPLFFLLIFGLLTVCELFVGLFKWVFPSAEGFLLDALLLLVFVAFNLGIQALIFAGGRPPDPVWIGIGLLMLFGAIRRLKLYWQIRRAFAERPTAEQMAWFDDLAYEIRTADPYQDELALDLPTKPHWKAKLLGTTAFFIAARGTAVQILGPYEFDIAPEFVRAILRIKDHVFPEFELGTVSYENYKQWRSALEREAAAVQTSNAYEGRVDRP
jgi:hypothetical protein